MSHHLDSSASRRDPRLNVTDIYAFDGDDATVLAMIVNTSLAGPGRMSGFHPEGRYEFKVHLDGGATEQLAYRFSFGPAEPSGAQRVVVDRLAGRDAGDDHAAGSRIAEGRTGEAIPGSGVRAWCGPAADPFYLDLHHLAHVLEGLQNEQPIEVGEWTPAQAASSFTGSQVGDESGVRVVRAGDVISSPPGGWHWHGAVPGMPATHVTFEQPGDFDRDVDRRDWDDSYSPGLGA